MDYIVEMLDIRKEFPGIVACDNITFQLRKGEVHALLGENGAGKSTLTSILFGLYQPDGGRIRLRGQEVHITNPNIANHLGIGMVHQHFKLVQTFTVTENIILGNETIKGLCVDLQSASTRIEELSKKYGLNVDPHAKIADVSVGMQQRVEIMKMLYRNADILIFDEPTAVLTPQEITDLMKIMQNLIAEGKSIILITHKLREIKAIADRCTVIRRGKLIGTVDVASTSQETLAEMMVGRKISFTVEKPAQSCGDTIVEITGLSVRTQRGVVGVKDFSLGICSGEIVGLAGVDGNGQAELVEAIIGLRKCESGSITFKGIEISSLPIRARIELGMSHIPDDRHKHGLILDYSLGENLILKAHNRAPFSERGLLNREAIAQHASKVIGEFDVRTAQGPTAIARSMSGGNQQKAIVGREVDRNPDLLIAVQPTRGLDVGAIEYIHHRLLEQRNKGKAILLVSLELDEILKLSDRIAVINHGELVGIVDANGATENEIGLMMAGVKRGATA